MVTSINRIKTAHAVNVEKYQHISDAALLDNYYLDGNNYWLGILLQRYTLLLLGVCMKYLKNEEEAKDSVQHVFLKAITELQKYKVDYFKSWIYMVAKNHCLMKIRERQGKATSDLTDNMDGMVAEEQNDAALQYLEREKSLDLMGMALEKLNEEQRRCVTLFYLEKQSYQEIAAATGYPLLKVKSCIQNGKRNLKILLDKSIKPDVT